MNELRPSPDELLLKIKEEERKQEKGKLKIFFGYAAGVGKTYAMLQSAHLAKEAKIDVAAGYIEPHARPETMQLLEGLEVLPSLSVDYNGIILKEFDIDGALKRKPQLILIDELAHTNALGCRHEKRYQDIKELLNAGIDVYTTVNVQHLESINDVIAGITGVIVRERIPDDIFDEANQVELVDIEPEELLERLKEGKVYREKQANQALGNFFTIENLVALREIALRRMADRVNLIQEKSLTANKNLQGGTLEHILICLSPSPSNEKVIRQASRMAAAFHGKFTAFYVETPEFSKMLKENKERLDRNMRLAQQLGAKTVTSYGEDITEQIAEYAKISKVTKIVLGRSYTKRKLFSVKESFSERLVRLAPNLEIFIIPDSYQKKYNNKRIYLKEKISLREYWLNIVSIILTLLLATMAGYLFNYFHFSDSNIVMIYILSVLVIAIISTNRYVSVIYSIISIFVYNFCFTAPINTFSVKDKTDVVTFLVMFITAFISSSMTQKIKLYARQMAKKSYRTEVLLETSQKLQMAKDEKEIAKSTAEQLARLLERNIYFYLGNPEEKPEPYIVASKKEEIIKSTEELAVAEWTFKNNKHAGFSTTTLPGVKCLYLAVRNGDKVFAVVGIDMEQKVLPAFENSIMAAILNECAFALEKQELLSEQKKAEIKLNQEKLRANLLRSISHDLRTPLTSISGNAGVLMTNEDRIKKEQRMKLYENIYDDSMWLINLVENLLSVTRIENGTMRLHMQAELVDDIITESLKHISRRAEYYSIVVEQENDLLVANMDAKLIMQVIINLVDNALKYTEKGTEIKISTKLKGKDILIEVADTGDGISDEHKARLFEMFYTADSKIADGRRGMGLGLSLCQTIIQAHGGSISVKDNKPKGARFQFTLKAEEVSIK